MSGHPLHGTKPLAKALRTRAHFSGASGIQLWKLRVKCDEWPSPNRPHFLGTMSEAQARAERLGISWEKVSRV